MQTFIASVLVFGLLIFIHELGHFFVAKRVGIMVHEFSLGFGPKVFGHKRGETIYNLRLLPLGGFVRMAGMDPNEQEDNGIPIDRAFNNKTAMQRFAVVIAGSLMNFVLAIVLFAFIFMWQGMPYVTTEIGGVVKGFPAEKAGLRVGDRIVAVNNTTVEDWNKLVLETNKHPGEPLSLTVQRGPEQVKLSITTAKDETGQYKIGITPTEPLVKKLNPLAALAAGTSFTFQICGLILTFIGQMFTQQVPVELGGPVRVVSEIGKAAAFGNYQLMQLAAFLSINLGLFNLLPIPALDGSRALFLVWEKVSGRPVEPSKEGFIHLVGFGLLLLLMVVITYNDIVYVLFGNP